MNTHTIAIIVAILGVGLGLWRAIATIRQDVDSRHKDLRQDLSEIRQELRALHSRIDALYQALFAKPRRLGVCAAGLEASRARDHCRRPVARSGWEPLWRQ